MKNLKKAFGLRLKELRKSKALTQEKLSEMLDLSPRQLIRIENGESFPSADVICEISSILDIRLDTLFDFGCCPNGINFKNGICSESILKLKKKGEFALIEPIEKNDIFCPDINEEIKFQESDILLLKMSRDYNMPISVDYYENGKIFSVKKFYPNGNIEEVVSKEDIFNDEQYKYICSKLKKISKNAKKLAFYKIAIDSMDDRKSFEKLKILVQGMDLIL